MFRNRLCQVLTAAAIFTATAAAQNQLQCVATSGNPPVVRSEGVVEEVSQIVINCTGGTPIAAGQSIPTVTVQLFLNTNVTSRLLDSTGVRSEALLLIDEPTPANQIEAASVPNTQIFFGNGDGTYISPGHATIFGAQQASANSLVWLNIPFDPPGNSRMRTFRLVNIRANASMLPSGGLTPIPVAAFISISGQTIPLNNPQITVGYIQPGLRFTASPATYQNCQPGAKIYPVTFTELSGTSFRHQRSAAGDQNVPGTVHNTESMFYNSYFRGIGYGAGMATQGTRLSLRFTNVPSNVKITVPATLDSGAGDIAIVVPVIGSTADPVSGVVTVTGGTGLAVYEVMASNPNVISSFNLTVQIAYSNASPPGLGTITVSGNYSPVTTTMIASTAAAPRFLENSSNASTITIGACGQPVTASLNRTALAFAATTGGSAATPPQEVLLTMAGARNDWTATSSAAWLAATPAAGTGSGRFNIGLVPSALPAPGTYTGTITVNANGATNGPQFITCALTVKASGTAPFGSFDTPVDKTTGITGSIAVTGWALDDLAVKKVTIWRDRVGTEPVYPNGLVYIGDALFVPGARSDVEAKYPTYPAAYRAGWGYLMLTYGLPAQGNGTFRIHAIAVDQEGNELLLGSRTITVDNLHAVKPFGALDQPQPGETISGTYPVQGWALTPQPAFIDVSGATLWVHVDGVNMAHPGYGVYRADVASLFPGYANSATNGGSYSFNSTAYANGMHNIAWVLTDNLGRVDGIGSRYFHIWNDTSAPTAAPQSVQLRAALPTRRATSESAYAAFRIGYDPETALTPIRQAGDGLLEPVALNELGRVELHLPAGQQWTAALRFGDELRDLPIGSTFDAETGIFYWQLGPGFLGEFNLEFRTAGGTILNIPVVIGARTAPAAIQ